MKKYLLILSVFLGLLGSIYLYIQYNLARYSVYYASHMPRKEGAKPELIMALEHIDWIDKANTENVTFYEEENSSIYINKRAYFTYGIINYYVGVSEIDGGYFYYTDSSGKFVTYASPNHNWEKKRLEEEVLQELKTLLVPATKDIVKAQKTPTINLQKLFNQKYESRFNH